MILTFPERDIATAVWIDLVDPTPEEVERVRAATGLRVPTQGEVSEIESTSRLAFEKGAFYLSAAVPASSEDANHDLTSAGFVLSSRVLVTVRFAPLVAFETAHAHCASQQAHTAEEAFLELFELIVDRSADELERAGADCDELSRRAFRAAGRTRAVGNALSVTLRRLGKLANHASHIRESLLGLGRIAGYVAKNGIADAPTVNETRLEAIRADIASLTDYETHLSGEIQFLLDATLGFINIEQNEIVKTLTIASVVGIPPVLVAGIYGMNFRYMPELGWKLGYPLAVALIVVSAVVPLLWFRRRGWM